MTTAKMALDRVPAATKGPVFRPDITEREIAAVAETMRSGWDRSGASRGRVRARVCGRYRIEFRHQHGYGHSCAANSIGSPRPGRGDEVILPSFTWVSIFQVVLNLGASPVFADIEPEYLTIGSRMRATTDHSTNARHHLCAPRRAVGGCGVTPRKDAADHGIWLVDDAAHACGASWNGTPVGSLCDVTCLASMQ